MECKGVIFFDIDNTLVKTDEYFDYSLKKSILETKKRFSEIKETEEELLTNYFTIYNQNKNAQDHYKLLFEKYKNKEEIEKFAVSIRHQTKTEYKQYGMKYLQETVQKLTNQGYILGIISEGNKEKQLEKLELLGIKKYFTKELIFITNNQFEKNDRAYLKIGTNTIIKYNPKLLIMVGDHYEKDIKPAKKANFITVRIDYGKYKEEVPHNEKTNTNYLILDCNLAHLFEILHDLEIKEQLKQ
jgi:putative hydrolase of the HAD superfamily